MKKVALVVFDREREASLEALRKLGVVHLERKNVSSDGLSSVMELKIQAEHALGILRNAATKEETNTSIVQKTEPAALIQEVLRLADQKKQEQELLAADIKELHRIAAWGDFEPASLEDLRKQGITLIPYELPKKVYEKLDPAVSIIVLSEDKTLVRCVVVGDPIPGEQPFALPELSYSALSNRIAQRKQTIADIEKKLSELSSQMYLIERELQRLNEQAEFEAAKASMEVTEDTPPELAISWITGYIPADAAGKLKRAAAEYGWALIIDDPNEGDRPPTLVRNPAYIRIVQPIFDLLGTVPGYHEYDISMSFLVFFSLFFAMIIGDAGYGVLILLLSLYFGFKGKKKTGKFADGILLLLLLSSVTIIWGAINGTWFALPYDSLPAFLKALVIPPFRPNPSLAPKEAARLVQQNIKHLCFIIGTVQLVWAHMKNIKKALPSLTAFAQLGWLSMVLGLYFLVLNLVLDKTAFPVPPFAIWMIGGGLATYFVFAEQKGGNFIANILKSFANFLPTFLSAVSSFSDIISYIRLFAVGLAGFAIAESFNGMAAGLPAGMVRILAGALILFFGHGLNLAMSALSVVVHGVRLNMLEYSGHLGMEWSGVKYSPFAVKETAQQ
ncbi:V-type ATP synthase subunit I [Gracilinema caldarium]|nr:V-type ATPase 116kDa subunit family protein [Gracilinema caldarium]